MQPLAARVLDALRRGEAAPEALETAAAPEPERDAAAILRAGQDPDLAACPERWVPDLVRSARPGFGAHSLADLAAAARSAGTRLDLERTPVLPRLLGSSNFLTRLLLRRPEWVEELVGVLPDAPPDVPPAPTWTAIRQCKYRGLLRIAARDLRGRPLQESLVELSRLAERCLEAALACAGEETGAPAPAVLALGKLGGSELNFSSDVDLVFLSDPPDPERVHEHNAAVERLIRRFKSGLEAPSEEGFGYRVDLDLRPEGPSGVLVNSVDAALGYYEAYGAEWERQMLIRLRTIAGPSGTGEAFVASITPFVYRRLIDPGVMQAVRDMKVRIESERRRAGRDIDADLKEGPGGIRDIEFLVQSFQLFLGGRHAELRTGNVLQVLDALGELGLLPEDIVASLIGSYTWLRRAEHALQLVEEQQTAAFPRDRSAQIALARRLGVDEDDGARARDRLLDEWNAVRAATRQHFEDLVLRPDS